MSVIKNLSHEDAVRIISIYEKYNLPFLPGILSYSLEKNNCWIRFEVISGSEACKSDISKAFSSLGKMHLMCSNENYNNGFDTVCHGDFHLKNIIVSGEEIKFIDLSYLHLGWNYSDFDYVDFYDFYDASKYPWMIKDKDCLKSYCDGIEHRLSEYEENELKRKITINNLKSYIKNGIRSGIDISSEKEFLISL